MNFLLLLRLRQFLIKHQNLLYRLLLHVFHLIRLIQNPKKRRRRFLLLLLPIKAESESKSENGPHTAPTIEISSLQEPTAPTQLSLPSPTIQRSSSLTLSHPGMKNSHPSAIHQQRVIHHKTLSSSSYRHGNGSGTLSPSLMIANIQSPSRSHIHAVSLESVERVSKVG